MITQIRKHSGGTIAKNPSAWAAHTNLGNALLQAGKVQQAAEEFEAALDIEPFLAEPHNNLGTILVHAGRVEDAIGEYEKALQVELEYPEAQNNLGLALMLTGRSSEAHYNLAVLLENQGKPPFLRGQTRSDPCFISSLGLTP